MSARKSHAHQRPPETQESAMRRTGHWARASLGRLGWLVIRAFHASLLIGADLYLAGPSVESMRHGGADGRHLIPENNRHSRCDDDSSCNHGDGYRILHPANMRLRGTQASRIPCHNQTDPTTGGPRCGALAGPLSRGRAAALLRLAAVRESLVSCCCVGLGPRYSTHGWES